MPDVAHKSLALPGYWRITNFGKLVENPRSAGPDLRILTSVAPLVDVGLCPPHYGKIAGPPRVMYLPVGEMPRLYLNAILHDGKLQSHEIERLDREYVGDRKLNCTRDNIEIFNRHALDDEGKLIIPKGQWTSTDPENDSYFIAIGDGKDRYATIIPAWEVFRFFYATSDILTKALLRGHFLDPHTHLWNTNRTAKSSDGRVVIWLRKRMLDADARFLARFAFDEYALRQAQEIFLHAAARGPQGGDRMIKALPPFQDSVKMRFQYFGLANGERRLVTRLLKCDWKPPFIDLRWDRDNDGRFDPDNREERSPINWAPDLMYAKAQDNTIPDSLSDTPPSATNITARLKEEEISERFPELGKIRARKLPQEGAKSRAWKRGWREFMAEAYPGSVVEGQSSSELIGKSVIEAIEENLKNCGELTDNVDQGVGKEGYMSILRLLQAILDNGLAEVEFLSVLDTTSLVESVPFNVFPRRVSNYKGAWLFVDQEKCKRRMALVARVTLDRKTRYVIELQQKRDKECSTLVVWHPSEGIIWNSTVAKILLSCAEEREAAPAISKGIGLCWGRLEHTTKGDDLASAQHYLGRIFDTTQWRTRSMKSKARPGRVPTKAAQKDTSAS